MKQRKKKREPISLGSVFGEFLEKRGLTKRYLYDRALYFWKEAVGEEISSLTRPIRVENGTLVVAVENAVMRQELYFMKPTLIDSLNKKLGREIIRDLMFR